MLVPTCEMLRDLGHTVESCSDAEEAIDRYAQVCREIDLVPLDMMMRKKDGLSIF